MIKEELAQTYGDKHCCGSIDCEYRRNIVNELCSLFQKSL
jgi:hypothetical protein